MPKTVFNDAFWRWFGNSVVRNEDGTPKVVYHSTKSDFSAFDEDRSLHFGFHFGTREQAKRRPISKRREGVDEDGELRIVPVYLAIENPLATRDAGDWRNSYSLWETLNDATEGMLGDYEFLEWNAVPLKKRHRMFMEMLEEFGYDGIVYKNRIEGKGESWIAFRPEQIKSIHNDGTWNIADPDIGSNPPIQTMNNPREFRGWVSPTGEKLRTGSGEDHNTHASRILDRRYKSWDWSADARFSDRSGCYYAGMALEYRGWVRVVGEGMYSVWSLYEPDCPDLMRRPLRDLILSLPDDTPLYVDVTEGPKLKAGTAGEFFKVNPPPKRFWGRAGAGILFHCTADDTYLLVLRSSQVEQPGTLGIPGGACGAEGFFTGKEGKQIGEAQAWVCAMREAKEELSWWPKSKKVSGVVLFEKENFQYQTFIVDIGASEKAEAERSIKLNWENDEFLWMTIPEMNEAHDHLHYGVQYVLDQIGG